MSYVVHTVVNVPTDKVDETISIYQNCSKLVDQYIHVVMDGMYQD